MNSPTPGAIDQRPPANKRRRAFPLLPALLAFALCACEAGHGLNDFVSDGCSRFPDGTLHDRDKWLGCCYVHDVRYWQGGTDAARKAADEALRACVFAETGDKALATLMYDGVRVGGHPVFPAGYRWGYGWSYERGYAPLSADEQAQVARKKQQLCAQLATAATAGTVAVARGKLLESRFVKEVCPE